MKPSTLQEYKVEPAAGVTRSSGIATTYVILLRLRADGVQKDYVLSPLDASNLAQQILEQVLLISKL